MMDVGDSNENNYDGEMRASNIKDMDKESLISFRRSFVPTSIRNSLIPEEANRKSDPVDELTQVANRIS